MRNLVLASLALIMSVGGQAFANEYADELTAIANEQLQPIAQNPELVTAIMAQNKVTVGYDQAKIDALDAQWRAEINESSRPLIDEVLSSDASSYLMQVQEESQGLFTEIFAMDARGLNVGQSTITSDYWQGDEGKWQNTFEKGAGAIDIGDIEEDESTQIFQSQVSIPVLDTDGTPIGAITFGIDLEYL